jgi:type I restriction enzyme S subunit
MNNKTTTYKQTEVGLIPSDWEVKTIGEIFTFYSTSNYSKAEMSLYGDVGCVHYGLIHAIENSHYSLSSGIKYYVTKEQAKYEAIKEGDVIMVDASEDLVGLNKSVEVFDLNNKEYIAGLHTFHLRDNNSIYVGTFKGLILNSNSVKKQMLRFAVGMKVFGVSKPQLQNILIPVPTKAEQTAIATALSDADALISGLEKLITKKRNIKQGAMQKLLQPKEGWEVKKLGDFLDYEQPTDYLVSDTEYNDNNQTPVLTAGKTFILGYTNEEHGIFKNLPVIIFDDFTTAIKYVDFPFKAKSSAMKMLIQKNDKVNLRFVFEIMLQIKFQVADHKRHWIGEFCKLEITVPPTPEEQNAIAIILSDMDAEITALETKLEKYKKVKLGMMQNLLTGKIRLL